MNIYIYPKEIIAIEGRPETKVPATANLPAITCQPRVSIELKHGTIELTLTPELATQLSAALFNAFPGTMRFVPLDYGVPDSVVDRWADEHAAELR